MKRVVIIHGYTGYPDKNWFPWLKEKIELGGTPVAVPEMPDTNSPQADAWVDKLSEVVGVPDEETYLIGHSLGCPTILRYLEQLPSNQKIGGAILVAGFSEQLKDLPELDSFVVHEWDEAKIKSATKKITFICSDNDPYIPHSMAHHMHELFGGKLVILPNAGHINGEAHLEVPEILAEFEEMQ